MMKGDLRWILATVTLATVVFCVQESHSFSVSALRQITWQGRKNSEFDFKPFKLILEHRHCQKN